MYFKEFQEKRYTKKEIANIIESLIKRWAWETEETSEKELMDILQAIVGMFCIQEDKGDRYIVAERLIMQWRKDEQERRLNILPE